MVAIDEYENALRAIAVHAEIGLSAGPGQAEAALRAIRMVCEKTSETVEEVLSHPDAVSQASAVSCGGWCWAVMGRAISIHTEIGSLLARGQAE